MKKSITHILMDNQYEWELCMGLLACCVRQDEHRFIKRIEELNSQKYNLTRHFKRNEKNYL